MQEKDSQKRVVIFSGAGLSAESGLRTFRDNDGLWEEYDVMEVCSVQAFAKDRQKVLDFYDLRRKGLAEAMPNAAHKMIARLKSRFKGQVCVITQNVDDLLERADCAEVLHLHGFLPEIRCEECGKTTNIGYEGISGKLCGACGNGNVRHNIVMFGEFAPHYATLNAQMEALHKARGLFICIGTSGEVINAAQLAQYAGKSVLNNLESSWLDRHFDICFIESASAAAPKIEALVEEYLG